MNGFERHSIDHLSASSLNQWASVPALWALERLLGLRSPISSGVARGTAVEEGIHAGLLDAKQPLDASVAIALASFDRQMALIPDDRREAERANIAGYVENGLAELRQFGVPTAYQDRVEIHIDDVPVPIVGFIDWRFDQHGLLIDLKTSERLPLSISLPHARQGTIYARAHANYAMRFAYTRPTATKRAGRAVAVYELERAEVERQLVALRHIALRLERFLALSADPRELCGLLVPNYEDFRWANTVARAHGVEVFGF
jgi:hypothetical protein